MLLDDHDDNFSAGLPSINDLREKFVPSRQFNLTLEDRVIRNMQRINPPIEISNPEIIKALQILTTQGNALNGHRAFTRNAQNLSIVQLLDIISNDYDVFPYEIKDFRKNLHDVFNSTEEMLEELIEVATGNISPKNSNLYSGKHQGLMWTLPNSNTVPFGLKILQSEKENTPEFVIPRRIFSPWAILRGFYMMSMADNAEMREMTKRLFPETFNNSEYTIGYGENYIGNYSKISELAHSIITFAKYEQSEDTLKELFERQLLIDKDISSDDLNNMCVYVRRKNGLGVCDDMTFLGIGLSTAHKVGGKISFKDKKFSIRGFNFFRDSFLGAMLADTYDTLDKVALPVVTGGSDEIVGRRINDAYKRLTGRDLATPEEICAAIYFGAKNNYPRINMSNSVMRLQTRQENRTPIENHLIFMKRGKSGSQFRGYVYGFEKVDANEFYSTVRKRMESAVNLNLFG